MVSFFETDRVRSTPLPLAIRGGRAHILEMAKREMPVIDTDFPPTSSEAVAARLRILREAMGYPLQQDWCEAVGLKQPAWSQWERGVHRIASDAAVTLCDRFSGLTTDWIYRGLDETLPRSYQDRIREARETRRRRRDMLSGAPVRPSVPKTMASAR
jgi:transcriptional regulator with XRE-family HTH domain